MKIDISKIKVGDRVVIEGVVAQIDPQDEEMPVDVEAIGWVFAEQIMEHIPRKVSCGDVVRLRAAPILPGANFVVIGVNEGFVWMTSGKGNAPVTALADEVEFA